MNVKPQKDRVLRGSGLVSTWRFRESGKFGKLLWESQCSQDSPSKYSFLGSPRKIRHEMGQLTEASPLPPPLKNCGMQLAWK